MKILGHTFLCALLCAFSSSTVTASVIPALAPPTYALVPPAPAIVTAQSHQVVARHYNRLYVPAVATHTHALPAAYPAVAAIPTYAAYPSYSYATTSVAAHPGVYRYGAYPYGYYPVTTPAYGYGGYGGYGYGGTYW